MNAPSLSTSILRGEKGSSSSSRPSAAITEAPSRLSSGRQSLQPVALSVATSVQRKQPSIHLPRWSTGSISSQPALFTFPQPLNVRTAVGRATALRACGGRRQPLPGMLLRAGASSWSIVALLMLIRFRLTTGSSSRWPGRSIGSLAFQST